MRCWIKTRNSSNEPFIVVNGSRTYRIPDDVLCANCWISTNTGKSITFFKWKELYCAFCTNTLLDPIPFSEVWGL